MLKLDTEAIAKFFNILKLPKDFFWVILLFFAFFLFSPDSWKQYFGINDLCNKYKQYVSIGFIFSSIYIFMLYARNGIQRIKSNKSIKKKINNLTNSEQSFLREFYLQKKDDIFAPIDNEVLVTLRKERIIYITSDIGTQGLTGFFFPVSLTQKAKKFINKEKLGFPEKSANENNKWLNESRPDFIGELDYIKRLLSY